MTDRSSLFALIRPWLDRDSFTPARISALDGFCDRMGLAPAPETPPAAANDTYDREKLYAELIRDEGLRLQVYRCTANKLTIGIGRNLDDNPLTAEEERHLGKTQLQVIRTGITREQAFWLKAREVEKGERALDQHLPWWRRLNDTRQRVLLNMWFNLGTAGLLKFNNTLRLVEAGSYSAAASNMLASLWARQVGDRARRLSLMMKNGS